MLATSETNMAYLLYLPKFKMLGCFSSVGDSKGGQDLCTSRGKCRRNRGEGTVAVSSLRAGKVGEVASAGRKQSQPRPPLRWFHDTTCCASCIKRD